MFWKVLSPKRRPVQNASELPLIYVPLLRTKIRESTYISNLKSSSTNLKQRHQIHIRKTLGLKISRIY